MWLFILTFIGALIIFLLVRRQRRFLKKDLKEVISSDMKKELNLPTQDNSFSKELERESSKSSASKEIVKTMNKETF